LKEGKKGGRKKGMMSRKEGRKKCYLGWKIDYRRKIKEEGRKAGR
jgi:hypothetical protein